MLDTTDSDIDASDLYFILDGGKTGNHEKLLSGFVSKDGCALPKKKHMVTVFYDEESCLMHHERVRGFSTINQTESLVLVSKINLNLNEKKRLYNKGSNRGNIIGPLAWPSESSLWKKTKAEKNALFGETKKKRHNPRWRPWGTRSR